MTATRRRALLAAALTITAALLAATLTTPVNSPAAATPLDDQASIYAACVARLADPRPLTNAQRTWLRTCRDALAPAPTPTPTASPTATPTPTVVPTTTTASTPPPTTPAPTATPPPTASPPATGCLANPGACGYPDASSTGPTGTLTPVSGTVTLSTPGAIFADRAVTGCIVVRAPNVTIRNVSVRCLSGGYAIDYYDPNDATAGTLTVEDTTVDCGNRLATAIGEMRMVVRRVEVTGCEHGFDIDYAAQLDRIWCHDLADQVMFPDGHTDCVIGLMTHDVSITGSTLLPGKVTTSAIEGDCGTCGATVRTGWTVRGNLMDGGAYTLYCTQRSTETGSTVAGNRFGRGYAYGYATSCDAGVAWSNNVDDATGAQLGAQ